MQMRLREHAAAIIFVILSASTLSAQVTVTVTSNRDPLLIGTCGTVLVTSYDRLLKGTPRNEAGHYLSGSDYDLKVESTDKTAVVGKRESASIWSACACQAATVGSQAVITATYPAKALSEKLLVSGVPATTTTTITIGKSGSGYSPPGCDSLKATAAAIARAAGPSLSGVKTPISTSPGGPAAGGAASGGATSSGAAAGGGAGGAASGAAASGGSTTGGAAVGGVAAGGATSGGALAGAAPATITSGGATAGGAAVGGAAGSITSAGGIAGAAPGGAAGGSSTTGSASAGITAAGSGSTGGAAQAGSTVGAPVGTVTAGSARGGSTLTAAPAVAGPAPTNVRVLTTGFPLLQQLVWDRPTGISGYQVSFKMSASVTDWTLMTAAPIKSETYSDSSFRQPGVMYRVTALYADGRQGSTDLVYSNPPPLKVPTKFQAEEVSAGTVRLSWLPVPLAKSYRVTGSGRPADGTVVIQPTNTIDGWPVELVIPNLPLGTYTWQITADYGGAYQTAGLPTASITLYPLRFRVSILGFKAITETIDDQLSRDGKNNEVYAAAVVCTGLVPKWVTRPVAPAPPPTLRAPMPDCKLVQSAVHGDVNGFPGRIKAGSGSASGGITSGDLVGSGPNGSTAGSTTTFPFLLWEGDLLPDSQAVWIAPSLWESGGNDDQLFYFPRAVEAALGIKWGPPAEFPGLGWSDTMLQSPGFLPMNQQSIQRCAADKGNDRPIGLSPPPYAGYPPSILCNIIGLTRAKVEAVLRGSPQEPGKPVGVLTMDLVDAVSGHYVMYLKLERVY